jgi:fimbrial chaperone protein
MRNHRKTLSITLLICIVTIAVWSGTVSAQALQIMPVSLSLSNADLSSTLVVTNRGDQAQTVQVRPFLWSQTKTGDTLTPTESLSASPPMTVIAAGATQVFRILLRQPTQGTEASYRLLFDQLPPPGEPFGGVRLALRLSVPVFVKPAQPGGSGVAWSVLIDDRGAYLHAENRGDLHLRIVHPVLNESVSSKMAVPAADVGYILAGAARDWPIPGGQKLQPGSVLHLTATSDQGPVDATVHVLQR